MYITPYRHINVIYITQKMELRNGKHVVYIDYKVKKQLAKQLQQQYHIDMNLLYSTHIHITHLQELMNQVDNIDHPYYWLGSYLFQIDGIGISWQTFNVNTFTNTQIVEYFKGYAFLCEIEYEYRNLELALIMASKYQQSRLPVFVTHKHTTTAMIQLLYKLVSNYETYDTNTFLVKKISCYCNDYNTETGNIMKHKIHIDIDTYFTNMRTRILELLYGAEMRGLQMIQQKYHIVLPAIYEYLVDDKIVSICDLFRIYNIVY